MALSDPIDVNPKIMLGKPVIRGTRIPVELILRKLSEGASEQDLLDAYPHLYGKLVWGDYALCFPVMQVREAAEQAQAAAERQAQQERQAREAAEQQVEQLLTRLKQAGIEP